MNSAKRQDVWRSLKPRMSASEDINTVRIRFASWFDSERNNNSALKRQRALGKVPFEITGVVNCLCTLDHLPDTQAQYRALEQGLLTETPRIKTAKRANDVRHSAPATRLRRCHTGMREHGMNMHDVEQVDVLFQPALERR